MKRFVNKGLVGLVVSLVLVCLFLSISLVFLINNKTSDDAIAGEAIRGGTNSRTAVASTARRTVENSYQWLLKCESSGFYCDCNSNDDCYKKTGYPYCIYRDPNNQALGKMCSKPCSMDCAVGVDTENNNLACNNVFVGQNNLVCSGLVKPAPQVKSSAVTEYQWLLKCDGHSGFYCSCNSNSDCYKTTGYALCVTKNSDKPELGKMCAKPCDVSLNGKTDCPANVDTPGNDLKCNIIYQGTEAVYTCAGFI
jgi:hypothetical protein